MDSEYFCYSWANAMTPREIVFHRKNVEILLKSTSVTICNTNNQEPFDSLDSIFFFLKIDPGSILDPQRRSNFSIESYWEYC